MQTLRRIRVLPRQRPESTPRQAPRPRPFRSPREQISVIVPALNDSSRIVPTLLTLQPLRGVGHEVILVDGGGDDDTVELARDLVDQVLESAPCRIRQMNLGARRAWGETLLFLQPGGLLPEDADGQIFAALERGEWGCFEVRAAGNGPLLRIAGRIAGWHARIAGVTGEQGLFLRRALYERLGGFPEPPSAGEPSVTDGLRRTARPVYAQGLLLTG